MGDRQWPDPRGWEALTQAEAERDARRVLTIGELLAVVASEASENPYVGSQRQKQAWDEIKRRVAVAERERDQAREALAYLADDKAWEVTPQYQTDGRYRFIPHPESVFATPWGFARAALAEEPQT